jgi:hypothetical protein
MAEVLNAAPPMSDKRTKELVTPELAAEWLKRIKKNRKINKYRVDGLAHDMERGKFHYNGVPVCFNNKGELMDGQHRLSAIVQSGKAQMLAIERDLDGEVFDTYDIGLARNTSHYLQMEGYRYSSNVAAAARNIYSYVAHGTFEPNNYVTHQDKMDTVRSYPDIAKYVNSYGLGKVELKLSPSVLATVHVLLKQYAGSKKAVDEFMDGVVTGESLPHGDPRLTVRNWIVRRPMSGSTRGWRGRSWSMHVLNQLLQAWNNWRLDEKVHHIKPLKFTPEITK